MIIKPKVRGFICTNAHPQGCAANVQEQIAFTKAKGPVAGAPKKVLVLGCSTGFGLASRITAAFGGGADTVGVCFEKEPSEAKTATAGYYNTSAFHDAAKAEGLYAHTINGDAFSDACKEKVIAELNYSPSPQARGLASSRSYLLGLIYDNPDALYLDDVQRGVLEVCSQLGYELVVHPCRYRSETLVQDCFHFINRSKLDGVIVLPPVSELDHLATALKDAGRPYVRLTSVLLDETRQLQRRPKIPNSFYCAWGAARQLWQYVQLPLERSIVGSSGLWRRDDRLPWFYRLRSGFY